MTRRLLFLLFALMASHSALGQTPTPQPTPPLFYVSTAGSDSNPGTFAKPLATLARAATLVQRGGNVVVMPGSYAGFIAGYDDKHPAIVGTKESPITFQAIGDVKLAGNGKTNVAIELIGSRFVRLDGFAIPGVPTRPDGTVDRRLMKGISLTGSHDILIRGCKVDGAQKWGIYASKCDNLWIEGCRASGSLDEHGIYVANTCVEPTVCNSVVSDNKRNGIHLNGDASQGGEGVIRRANIFGNTLSGNGTSGGSAINCDGVSDSIIRTNTIKGNRAAGISLYRIDAAKPSTGNLVEANVIDQPAGAKGAIQVKNGSTGNQLKDNVVTGPGTAVVFTPDSLAGTIIEGMADGAVYSMDDGRTRTALEGLRKAVAAAGVNQAVGP